MIDIDDYNRAMLAMDSSLRRTIRRKYRAAHPTAIVMSIKPKYAQAIYDGRKNWEFRKAPPPLYKTIYVYESAPVSKITGLVMFCASVRGIWLDVWEMARGNKCFFRNLPGISKLALEEYAGKKLVTALRVYKAERIEHPVEFTATPPQNWGTFAATYSPPKPAPLSPDAELAATVARQKGEEASA